MNRPPRIRPFDAAVLLLSAAYELLGLLHDLQWY